MPGPNVRNNRFASLRSTYDLAFAVLCHARKELEARCADNVMEEVIIRLQKNVDLSQIAVTRARNDLTMYLLERLRERNSRWSSDTKLIVPAARYNALRMSA